MRKLVLLFVFSLFLLAPEARAQFVAPGGAIPVVANLPGLAGTFWRSDVNILNLGESATSVVIQVFPEIVGGSPAFDAILSDPISIAAHTQLSMSNVLQTRFGLTDTKGALFVSSTDGAPLVLSSRTYTFGSSGGSYGQDVTSVLVASSAWASGLRHDSLYRTNLGVLWMWEETGRFDVTVYTAEGEEIGSGAIVFDQPGMIQKSLGSFGVDTLSAGYLEITAADSTAVWYAYVSRVDQITGDAVFRPARGYQEAIFP